MSKVIRIGRLTNNDISYSNSSVSRQHADLTCNDDGSYILTDHSSYGTSVNGRMLKHSSMKINYGDNVLFANSVPLDWSRIDTLGGATIIGDPYPPVGPVYAKKNNGFAIAGFVCSFFFSVLGLIFSIIGLNKVDECGGKGRGLAIAGIAISAFGIFCEIVWLCI